MAAVKNICTYVQVIKCTINLSVPLSLKYMFLTLVLDLMSGLFLLGLGYCFGFLKSKLRKADLLSVTETYRYLSFSLLVLLGVMSIPLDFKVSIDCLRRQPATIPKR